MTAQAETRFAWFSPRELVEAVRSGRVLYPSPRHPSAADTARTLEGLRRGLPVRPLLLWQEPGEVALWLLDGGDLLGALLRSFGVTDQALGEGPVWIDSDTGEVVAWGQGPPREHVVLDVVALLTADDVDAHLAAERLAGPRAERVRAFVGALREPVVPAQITNLPRADLPALFGGLPMRRGASIQEIDRVVGPERGPRPEFFAWDHRPRSLVVHARSFSDSLTDEQVWRLLLAAAGVDPTTAYDPDSPDEILPGGGRPAVVAVIKARHAVRGWFGWGGRLLPDPDVIAVVARFLHEFPTIDDATIPLLRRWAWRAVLSDHDIDLPTIVLDLVHGEATASALRLLERTPTPAPSPPGRTPLDPDSRRGRLVLLGIASLHPRDLTTGTLVDVETTRPRPILHGRPTEPANLLLHGDVHRAGFLSLLDAVLAPRSTDLLAGHGIDAEGVRLLAERDDEGFLARRAALLDTVVPAYWAERTEPQAASRRPVALLFEDADAD